MTLSVALCESAGGTLKLASTLAKHLERDLPAGALIRLTRGARPLPGGSVALVICDAWDSDWDAWTDGAASKLMAHSAVAPAAPGVRCLPFLDDASFERDYDRLLSELLATESRAVSWLYSLARYLVRYRLYVLPLLGVGAALLAFFARDEERSLSLTSAGLIVHVDDSTTVDAIDQTASTVTSVSAPVSSITAVTANMEAGQPAWQCEGNAAMPPNGGRVVPPLVWIAGGDGAVDAGQKGAGLALRHLDFALVAPILRPPASHVPCAVRIFSGDRASHTLTLGLLNESEKPDASCAFDTKVTVTRDAPALAALPEGSCAPTGTADLYLHVLPGELLRVAFKAPASVWAGPNAIRGVRRLRAEGLSQRFELSTSTCTAEPGSSLELDGDLTLDSLGVTSDGIVSQLSGRISSISVGSQCRQSLFLAGLWRALARALGWPLFLTVVGSVFWLVFLGNRKRLIALLLRV